jgi:hypothetical protein
MTGIMQAFFNRLNTANLGYPIAWPNTPFTNKSGNWLEVIHQPNEGIDQALAIGTVIKQGIFTVIVHCPKNGGAFKNNEIAAEVAAVFPKLTALDDVRVNRAPFAGSLQITDVDAELALTVSYSG